MIDQTPGKNGVPGNYTNRKIETVELYDLVHDISETTDLFAQHPEIVKQLETEAEKARADLGDALTQRPGLDRRDSVRSKPCVGASRTGCARGCWKKYYFSWLRISETQAV
jgi:arylsulfatase